MTNRLTPDELAEIHKRHKHVCRIGGITGREHQQSPAHKDRDSLLKHITAMEAKLAIAEVNVVEWRHCAKVNEGLKISAEQANANLTAALLEVGVR